MVYFCIEIELHIRQSGIGVYVYNFRGAPSQERSDLSTHSGVYLVGCLWTTYRKLPIFKISSDLKIPKPKYVSGHSEQFPFFFI